MGGCPEQLAVGCVSFDQPTRGRTWERGADRGRFRIGGSAMGCRSLRRRRVRLNGTISHNASAAAIAEAGSALRVAIG